MNKRIFSCFSSAISSSLTVLVLFLPVLLSCSRKQEDMKPFDLVSRLEMQKTVTEVKTHSRIKKVVRWNIQKGTQTAMDSVLTYPFEDFQLSKIPLAQKVCLDSAGALARTDSIQGMTPAVLLYIKNTVSILSNDSRMEFWYLLPFALLFIVFSSLFYIRSIWAEVKDQK